VSGRRRAGKAGEADDDRFKGEKSTMKNLKRFEAFTIVNREASALTEREGKAIFIL